MRDFLKSKFFTVVVIIAMVMVIVPTVFGSMGLTGVLKDGINIIFSPLQKVFTYCTDAVDGFTSFFTEFDRIVEENNALREEINTLRDKISSAEEAEEMNQWLYNYLELKREHTDFRFTEATVSAREGGNYTTVFMLDKGKAHGIEKDMPVVTEHGIVGYVCEVGTTWAKAVTFLEEGTAIGAYVERSGAEGVIEGSFSLAEEGVCLMSYLSADADIKEGDRIVSSGYGSVYPRGLVIGTVEKIEKDSASRSVTVTVRPGADLSDLKKMMIITDYEVYTEQSE
ncbi:MAG: rod shape-determining protein MreC [Ruminococcaceae bacterium]|nr:rod shape-determining protein MreC [Oscillospiraceae bacterium]